MSFICVLYMGMTRGHMIYDSLYFQLQVALAHPSFIRLVLYVLHIDNDALTNPAMIRS